MRVYVSGPMTGRPGYNYPAFDAAEGRLVAQGHFVVNPACISVQFGNTDVVAHSFGVLYSIEDKTKDGGRIDDYAFGKELKERARLAQAIIDADLAAVRSCDAIYLLRGWETSRGAKKELAEAIAHGLTIMLEEPKAPKEEEPMGKEGGAA